MTQTLSDYIAPADVRLDLRAATGSELLAELVGGLDLEPEQASAVLRMLLRREEMGSTGIGRGIAVPHCRTPLVRRLRVIYGRRPGGVEFGAPDGVPVEHFFLLVAPPVEVSNDYLPVLGRVAQLAKEPDTPARLAAVRAPAELTALLVEKRV
jgi:mannitol/fructose-specific phosphotransferase system IIA component (Ntr-type)